MKRMARLLIVPLDGLSGLAIGGHAGPIFLCMAILVSMVMLTMIILACGDHQENDSAKNKKHSDSMNTFNSNCGRPVYQGSGSGGKASPKKEKSRTTTTSSSKDDKPFSNNYGDGFAVSAAATAAANAANTGGHHHSGHCGYGGGGGGGCGGGGGSACGGF